MKTKVTPYGLAEVLEGNNIPFYFEMEPIPLIGSIFSDVYSDSKSIYGFNAHQVLKYSLKSFKRALKLLTDKHEPRYVRIYDNEGQTLDRYTVVFTKKPCYNFLGTKAFLYVGMSADPYHSFCQHGDSDGQPIDRPKYSHLGKKIKFSDLPLDCQKVVFGDYADLWNF